MFLPMISNVLFTLIVWRERKQVYDVIARVINEYLSLPFLAGKTPQRKHFFQGLIPLPELRRRYSEKSWFF